MAGDTSIDEFFYERFHRVLGAPPGNGRDWFLARFCRRAAHNVPDDTAVCVPMKDDRALFY